ncbi:MAG: DNA primase [Candidatus Elulimicrobiales bacterium]|nr:DNA primase [Candidatus Elulimicrobiales bacterium]
MNPKDQVKQALSILDVVSTYIRVEKAGSQFKARCPFHNEKTPSFFLSPDRGTYHCFGCGEHGDIFSFVEKMEAVPFYEALTILADRAGIKLSPYKKEEKDKEPNLISLVQKANKRYEENLQNSAEVKAYLGDRGLTSETIKKFNIGFSLGADFGWRDIFIYLSKEGFSPEEMIEAGLVFKKENEDKYFDRFRGRVMFPIKNTFGNIVGFSARILPKFDDGKTAKYINSPETPIYHKSKILFGYDLAKKSIADKREAILVEGQMDLIMSHQAEVTNVVATSGTAVTDEHIKILKRFADKVLLSFDQDEAGENAMKKCAFLALYGGLDVYIIPKKENVKDTADLIKEFGGEVWKDLISKRVHLIEYLVNNIFEKNNDERERGREVRKEVLPFLRAIESDIDRAYFIKYLASKLNVQEIDILNELKRVKVENVEENISSINKEINLTDKNKFLREILVILNWKKLDEEKFFNKFFEAKDIYKEKFLEFKKDLPEEILEQEIIRIEKEISKNKLYIENEKKFITEILGDLAKVFKIEVLQEEKKLIENKSEKVEEDFQRIGEIYQEIHKIKNLK